MFQIRPRTPVKLEDDVDLSGLAHWTPAPDTIFAKGIEDVCRAFARKRERLGLTQEELDELCGVPEGYTSKIESGRNIPLAML